MGRGQRARRERAAPQGRAPVPVAGNLERIALHKPQGSRLSLSRWKDYKRKYPW
jgi:hypothetical protein